MYTARKWAVFALVAWTAALPALAGNPSAFVSGAATLNGAALAASTPLAAGDVIATGPTGNATVVFGSAQVRAAASTSFRMAGSAARPSLRLDYGSLALTGALPVSLASYSITASPAADYTVAWNGDAASVSVNAGAVAIKGVGRDVSVSAGEVSTWDTPPQAKSNAAGNRNWKIILVSVALTVVVGIWVHEATRCSHCVSY